MRSYENSKKKIMEIAGVQECYEVQFNLPTSLYHMADESGKGIEEVLYSWLEKQSFTLKYQNYDEIWFSFYGKNNKRVK